MAARLPSGGFARAFVVGSPAVVDPPLVDPPPVDSATNHRWSRKYLVRLFHIIVDSKETFLNRDRRPHCTRYATFTKGMGQASLLK